MRPLLVLFALLPGAIAQAQSYVPPSAPAPSPAPARTAPQSAASATQPQESQPLEPYGAPDAQPPMPPAPAPAPSYERPSPYQPYYAPTPRYRPMIRVLDHYEERPRYGLALSGGILFGATYTVNAMIAFFDDDGYLAIPVVGPLIEIVEYGKNNSLSDLSGRSAVLFGVLDTLAQSAGLTMLIVGLTTHQKVAIYRLHEVSLRPTAGRSMLGLMAQGSF